MKALILAAGMGTRMKSDTPKSLIKLSNNKSLLQIMINYCKNNSNITDISVVIGYNKDSFNTIINDNPDVNFIYNEYWNTKSNLYSLVSGLNSIEFRTGDSLIIIDADTYIRDQYIFDTMINKIIKSYYYSAIITCDKINSKDEWIVKSHVNKVLSIEVNNSNVNTTHITSGITFFSGHELQLLIQLSSLMVNNNKDLKYWDTLYVPSSNGEYESIEMGEIYIPGYLLFSEVDTPEDIEFINNLLIEESEELYKRLYCCEGTDISV